MARRAGIERTLLGMALASSVSLVHAQPSVDAHVSTEDAPPAAGDSPTVRSARPVVLFLMPQLDSEVQSQLREALLAQFTLVDADLVFEPATGPSASLAQRAAQTQALAAERGAIAAFWIDDQPDGRWFVHMMDNQLERIIVRPVDARNERRAAAIEAVAVITRESTHALIEGVPLPPPIAASPAPPPPKPPPPPPALPKTLSPKPLRLWAGYVGSDFAQQPQVAWQHGAALGASWLGFAPVYGGLSYLFAPAMERKTPVAFSVQRVPFAAYGGYRYQQEPVALDAELGLSVEWLLRTTARAQPTGSAGTPSGSTAGSTIILVALAPRIRAELKPLPFLGVFAAGGIDIILNNFKYIEGPKNASVTLLSPNRVRPVAEAGLAFYP